MTMNATQAMKMNMIFWNSPIPNSESVRGITAATGILRPTIISGAKKALDAAETAAEHAQRNPHQGRQPKPRTTRFRLTSVLRVRAWSNQRLWKSSNVSSGLGRTVGPRKRSSGIGAAGQRPPHHAAEPDAERPQQECLPRGDVAAQRESVLRGARARRPRGSPPSRGGQTALAARGGPRTGLRPAEAARSSFDVVHRHDFYCLSAG